jgi:hypothetical protein
MTDTTYRMAGLEASAVATRARCVVPGAGLAANASWPIAAAASVQATKPATQMFVDVLDHRRRRLSEPSP